MREDHFHDGPMPGQQEFNHQNRPLLGGEEFNPTSFVPPGPMPGS